MNCPHRVFATLIVLPLLALATAFAADAAAQNWPARSARIVVPFQPGGGADIQARILGRKFYESFGQTFVVDNRSGAGGTIGIAMAARAPADGHTMVIGATSITYLQTIYPAAGFDFTRDLAPVSALARIQLVLVVNPAVLDVSSLAQFIGAAKKKPDAIDFGSPGIGTVPHLAIELLQGRADIKLHHVPYRNGAQMMQDVLAGQIAATWATPAEAAAHAKGGKLRALGIPGRRREPMLPDVPTFDEAGLKDFRAAAWFALFAPRRTPEAILDRLHDAVQEALAADDVKALWAEQGAKVELESRADFSRFVEQEIVRWNRIAKAANIQLE
jgi:tripartite-type tricarboxylate transporter receptor subunit TctC